MSSPLPGQATHEEQQQYWELSTLIWHWWRAPTQAVEPTKPEPEVLLEVLWKAGYRPTTPSPAGQQGEAILREALEMCLPIVEEAFGEPCPLEEFPDANLCRECEANGCLKMKIDAAYVALRASVQPTPPIKGARDDE